jgi:membrane glycosyltransferase
VSHAVQLVPLVLATAAILYGPKLLALFVLLCRGGAARAHGGVLALSGGVLGESIFSTLLAPIVMLQHSWFVFNILAGISTGWGAQQRRDRALPFLFVLRSFLVHTVIGAAAAALLWRYAGPSFAWFVPLLAGLLLAIPLVRWTSSLELGERVRRAGLFLVPSETGGVPVLSRAHALAARVREPQNATGLVVEDAAVRRLHLALLSDVSAAALPDRVRLALLVDAARRRDTAGFSREDWRALLSDPQSLKALS